MVREGNHLVPVDEMSAEELTKLPLKTQVLVKVTMPRNLRQHRLAWALATKVAEACEWLHDRDDAMSWLKIKARHVRYIHDTRSSEMQIIPKSIRFAALDQTGFDRVFKRMVYVTVTEIIPGLDEAALRAEIESMVGIDPTPIEPPKRQRKARELKPVSIIPPAEAITAADAQRKEPEDVPAADTVAAVPPPAPHDVETWVAWCYHWLAEADNDPAITNAQMIAKWTGERALRNECGITAEDREPMFKLYSEILDRKRAPK